MNFTHKVLCTICQEKIVERSIKIINPVCFDCKMLRNRLRTKRVRDSLVKKKNPITIKQKEIKLCMVCQKQLPKQKSKYCSIACFKS